MITTQAAQEILFPIFTDESWRQGKQNNNYTSPTFYEKKKKNSQIF